MQKGPQARVTRVEIQNDKAPPVTRTAAEPNAVRKRVGDFEPKTQGTLVPNPQRLDSLTAALGANRYSAIIYADADGAIRFWNAGAEALFGHSAEDVSGQRIDIVVPEEYRAMHWAGFGRAIGSSWRGSAAWGPVEGLRKNGGRIELEVFLTPIQEHDDRAIGVLAIFRVPI